VISVFPSGWWVVNKQNKSLCVLCGKNSEVELCELCDLCVSIRVVGCE
jgi:hypothetical protein